MRGLPLPVSSIPTAAERKSILLCVAFLAGALAPLWAASASADESLTQRRFAEAKALNAELLSRSSATETLTRWCADHHLAADTRIVAVKRTDVRTSPDAATLAMLGGVAAAQVKYRRVELTCGARILSVADNWYRPDRLTPEMNAALETTQTPFGVVVRPLAFTRRTVEITVTPAELAQSGAIVLRHRAVLSTAAGLPFSVVVESYTAAALDDTVE